MIEKYLLDYIKEHFTYNPETGIITRDDRRNSEGCLNKDGYIRIKVKKHAILAHRIAWFLYYGELPTLEIDHINRVRTDNRICNLRQVTRHGNVLNTQHKINPKTNVVGVYRDDCTKGLKKKYTVRCGGESHRFYNLEDAVKFREEYFERMSKILYGNG